ncbi:MAG: glycoside hydrolase family 27 protein [Acidobacteriota bacterium]
MTLSKRRATSALLLAPVLLLPACARETSPSAPEIPPLASISAHLALTPPMGFNTWNRFGCDIDEELLRETADALVETGMRDAGYRYVVVDDCWQTSRDADGRIVADPERFPSGMKALADYVHSQGLLFGLYTDVGPMTCQDRPGSLGYEEIDAATYAEWGVDYVKVDWCHSEGLDAAVSYRKFRDAFDGAGRAMVLSICEWGRNAPFEWAREIGHLWRTTADIQPTWESILWTADANERHHELAEPGRWNDPDMLQVGNGDLTLSENRAHFTLWALMAAPLMAGNDLRAMSEEILDLLTNTDVLAVNQDPLGRQGRIVLDRGYGLQVWAKPLEGGAVAVALLNRSGDAIEGYVRWSDVGLAAGAANVQDLWTGESLGRHVDDGRYETRLRAEIGAHDVRLFRLTPAPD